MNINPSWNYNEVIKNLKALKLQYQEVLASFSYVRDENNFIKTTRDNIYAMHLEEFQKDRVWEYLNGYLSPIEKVLFFGFWEGE